MLLLLASAAHSAHPVAGPPDPPCGTAVVDFEDLALSVDVPVGDTYAATLGVTFGAAVGGLAPSGTVGGEWGLVRGSRAGLVKIDPDFVYANDPDDVPPNWASLTFEAPVDALSLAVVDADQSVLLEAWYGPGDGAPDESLLLAVAASGVAGGRVVSVAFDAPVTTVLLTATTTIDEWAIDDVVFPGPACRDLDGDGADASQDCDDTDPATFPGATELCDGIANTCGPLPDDERDADYDGYLDCVDTDGDGVSTAQGDCAPFDPTSFPGAPEVCDGVANACGPLPDDERDTDFDGHLDCVDTDGDGVSTAQGDCAPFDPASFPGAPEVCDGVANACGPLPDDERDADFDGHLDCVDTDGDGVSTAQGDCAPSDPTTFPGAPELCDGVANTCGPLPQEEQDTDFDGHPDCVDTDGDGVSTSQGDCAPGDGRVFPGAEESCNGVDDDCDGAELWDVDGDYDGFLDCVDTDGDGVTTWDGDCGPSDPTVSPDSAEVCDGLDNDCDGQVPADEADADEDGFRACEDDCVDADPSIHPLAVELPNGVDANCDGATSGGQVGCSTAPTAPSLGLLALALVAARRRARRVAAAVLAAGGSVAHAQAPASSEPPEPVALTTRFLLAEERFMRLLHDAAATFGPVLQSKEVLQKRIEAIDRICPPAQDGTCSMEERVLRDRLQQLLAGLPTETGFQGLAGQYEDVLDELGGGPAPPDLRCAALVHGGLAALHEGDPLGGALLEEAAVAWGDVCKDQAEDLLFRTDVQAAWAEARFEASRVPEIRVTFNPILGAWTLDGQPVRSANVMVRPGSHHVQLVPHDGEKGRTAVMLLVQAGGVMPWTNNSLTLVPGAGLGLPSVPSGDPSSWSPSDEPGGDPGARVEPSTWSDDEAVVWVGAGPSVGWAHQRTLAGVGLDARAVLHPRWWVGLDARYAVPSAPLYLDRWHTVDRVSRGTLDVRAAPWLWEAAQPWVAVGAFVEPGITGGAWFAGGVRIPMRHVELDPGIGVPVAATDRLGLVGFEGRVTVRTALGPRVKVATLQTEQRGSDLNLDLE